MLIDKNGRKWYKGNRHTHTTRSDGRKSPEDTLAAYREMGFDFIALTDHWLWNDANTIDESGLFVLSGAEYNFNGEDSLAGVFHIVALGCEAEPPVTREQLSAGLTAQETIDQINACGGLAMLAHPAWSLNTHDMIASLRGLSATEIYNSVSGLPRNCRPYSGQVIDELAVRGHVLPLVADDDTHFWLGEAGMSYILVNIDGELTRESLLDAIRERRFFATQGPVFDLRREGDEMVVTCDAGAKCVTFFTNRPWENLRNVISDGEPVFEARYPIHENTRFVRAEVTDFDGKVGFSQVFTL